MPAGTLLAVRLDRPVNSEEVEQGDLLAATVTSPIVVNGDVVVATGAHAHLRVASVDPTAQNDGMEHLSLTLADVESERGKVHVVTQARNFNGPAKKADAAKRAGIGAAAGAVGGYVVGHLFHHGGAGLPREPAGSSHRRRYRESRTRQAALGNAPRVPPLPARHRQLGQITPPG